MVEIINIPIRGISSKSNNNMYSTHNKYFPYKVTTILIRKVKVFYIIARYLLKQKDICRYYIKAI